MKKKIIIATVALFALGGWWFFSGNGDDASEPDQTEPRISKEQEMRERWQRIAEQQTIERRRELERRKKKIIAGAHRRVAETGPANPDPPKRTAPPPPPKKEYDLTMPNGSKLLESIQWVTTTPFFNFMLPGRINAIREEGYWGQYIDLPLVDLLAIDLEPEKKRKALAVLAKAVRDQDRFEVLIWDIFRTADENTRVWALHMLTVLERGELGQMRFAVADDSEAVAREAIENLKVRGINVAMDVAQDVAVASDDPETIQAMLDYVRTFNEAIAADLVLELAQTPGSGTKIALDELFKVPLEDDERGEVLAPLIFNPAHRPQALALARRVDSEVLDVPMIEALGDSSLDVDTRLEILSVVMRRGQAHPEYLPMLQVLEEDLQTQEPTSMSLNEARRKVLLQIQSAERYLDR